MTRRRLTSAEHKAWARVARSIRPLGESYLETEVADDDTAPAAPLAPVREAKPPQPRQAVTPPKPSLPKAQPEYRRDRKVRRGQIDIEARFDLHGLTQAAADQHLAAFLSRQQQAGARCVLVITGKGRGGEGILRRNFLHWLESPAARPSVSSWAQAHPRHGGAGAFYLFLKRQ